MPFVLKLATDSGLASDVVPEEHVRKVLSAYLTRLTLNDKDEFGLHLPDNIPEGFYLTHKRLSKRTLYTNDSGFAVILSKEYTWRIVMGKKDYREAVSNWSRGRGYQGKGPLN